MLVTLFDLSHPLTVGANFFVPPVTSNSFNNDIH